MLEFLLWTFFDKDNQWADNPPITQSRWSVSELAINPIPQLKENDLAPKIINNPDLSILSIDLKSFKTLFAKDIYKPRSIASISKLMVYKIIRENHKLDEVVTIDLSVINTEGAKVGFHAYEKLSVKTLLQSILIPSANDGAIALAIWHAGSVDNFVKKMNEDAHKLGLKSAEFYNSTGLDLWDDKEKKWLSNKMSTYDIAKLVKYLLRDEFFRETIQQPVFEGSSINGDFFHIKDSTNKLLKNKLFKGVKTGYTYLAGQCLVSLASLPHGEEVVTIILGSGDRFGETSKLLSWIMSSFVWR